jgi:hypothetical protein
MRAKVKEFVDWELGFQVNGLKFGILANRIASRQDSYFKQTAAVSRVIQ